MKSDHDEITRELKLLGAEKLAAHNKHTGFEVPGGYFDSFAQSVQKNIATSEPLPEEAKTRYLSIRYVVGIAASFALLVVLAISFLLLRPNPGELYSGEFDDQAIEEYFANMTQHDRTLLYDVILDQENGSEEFNSATISEDDYLIEYLLDAARFNGIEPSELFTQNGNENQR